jgi:dipeptidyl aminopeptidase/acylaminoacyl peptidase
MNIPKIAPYGSWKSPITADLIVSESVRLALIVLDGEDTYWIEGRPSEGGRSVIVRRTPDGQTVDMTPPPFNVRTRVHEYGGGEYTVSNGIIYFSNFADQRLYRLVPGSEPQPLTPVAAYRYADIMVDHQRNRLICVREDHSEAGHQAVNTLVSLSRAGNLGGGQVLVSGNDFYASPRPSPDGSHLAWLTWNHPNMPWDGTELWVGEFNEDGLLGKTEQVAGGKDESIFQPEWSPDGVLHFISDRTGWWNLYRLRNGQIEPLCEKKAEFGLPHWVFGMSTYKCITPTRIICSYTESGIGYLANLDTVTGELKPFDLPYTTIGNVRATAERAVFSGASPTISNSIVQLDLNSGRLEVLRSSSKVMVDATYFSLPEPIEFPTEHGRTAYAFFYPPHNPDYAAPAGELPPLLVMSHGGPTSSSSSAFDLEIQFWTSRGIAVLDVNYGGSTGYGRDYRERLKGQWGIVDVDDCVNGARYLVERGLVDGNRLAITGGSAGGYTTLCALIFRNVFKAGASYYGISDLEALLGEDHKFESRYNDGLVGPYPERRDLYIQRSPIHFAERLSCPVIFFQGLEDKVVPPNQSERMVDVLKKKGVPVAYLAFEGEGHGFRRAENIKRALEAELYFYSQVFGFKIADKIEPVKIEIYRDSL